MVPELIEVMTTTAEKPDAQSIAMMLVEKRLAACVQISGPLESSYWWNDRVETAREWQVVVKTRGDLYGAVEAAIRAVHPYDEPEILALPLVAVSAGYRQWLLNQLALPVKGQTNAATTTEKPVERSDPKPAPRAGKASDKKQG